MGRVKNLQLKLKDKQLEKIIAKLGKMKLDTKKMVTNVKVSTVKSPSKK